MPAPELRPPFNYNALFHRPSCNQQCARAAAILRHRILSFSIIATLSNVIGLPTAQLAGAQVIWRAHAEGSYTERRIVQLIRRFVGLYPKLYPMLIDFDKFMI